MKDQLKPDETLAWARMLFQPGDVIEVRVKTSEQRGASQIWLPYAKLEDFARVHIPIHTENNRHIWVGVAPRARVGDSTPILHRALWADFSAAVKSVDEARAAIEAAKIPPATMLVWSGHGVHGYWALSQPASPEEAKPYAKGLHRAMPTDATHDSSRIMRVPGTINTKDPDHPAPCHIAEHHPERVYELSAFPKLEDAPHLTAAGKPAQMKPLSPEDRELFKANWLDGQKHHMVVAVAGYLRKNLHYDEASALDEIASIHREMGYQVDAGLIKAVSDTYERPFATVAGLRKLEELGIQPAVRDAFSFRFVTPPKRRIEIINFHDEMAPQEFWVQGLVGPGLLTLWAGSPKTGKSFAAMQIGHALATGSPLWDFPTTDRPRSVLYFQGELSRGMVYDRAKSMFGLAAVRDPRRYALTAKPDEPLDLVRHPEALTDLADAYDVVIIDPISVFSQNDETKSHSVHEVVSIFDKLRAQGKAVILVHHLRKLPTDREGKTPPPSFNDIRGSSAWFATADSLALHYANGESGNTRVKFMFRAAPDRDPLDLYRLPHGGFTSDKDLYTSTLPNFRSTVAGSLN